MKLSKNVIKTRIMFWVSNTKINRWFDERNVFFIVGVGRSGTKCLTHLLNKNSKVVVFHEPMPEDFDAFVQAHKSNQNALQYIRKFRKKCMYLLVPNKEIQTYGEVNSVLRYHTAALKLCFPNAKMLRLVRDGREVVRSFMARRHYTPQGQDHHLLSPKSDDPLFERWDKLRRFEKICWLWADANRRIRQDVDRYIQLEKLISDYTYFKQNIEDYLQIEIGRKQWRKAVEAPSNITKRHAIAHWTKWDGSLMNPFMNICREEMSKAGY